IVAQWLISRAQGGRSPPGACFLRPWGVVGGWRWRAAVRYVVVADRLDLFDPGGFRKPVEFAEQLIDACDDFIGLHARRDLAEADHVCKNDSGVIKVVRDVAFPVA